MTQVASLEARVASRKQELISELNEHKRNSCRGGAASSIQHLRERLLDLASIVEHGVSKGWAQVDAATAAQLDDWIGR